jgi:hypothetical protein
VLYSTFRNSVQWTFWELTNLLKCGGSGEGPLNFFAQKNVKGLRTLFVVHHNSPSNLEGKWSDQGGLETIDWVLLKTRQKQRLFARIHIDGAWWQCVELGQFVRARGTATPCGTWIRGRLCASYTIPRAASALWKLLAAADLDESEAETLIT